MRKRLIALILVFTMLFMGVDIQVKEVKASGLELAAVGLTGISGAAEFTAVMGLLGTVGIIATSAIAAYGLYNLYKKYNPNNIVSEVVNNKLVTVPISSVIYNSALSLKSSLNNFVSTHIISKTNNDNYLYHNANSSVYSLVLNVNGLVDGTYYIAYNLKSSSSSAGYVQLKDNTSSNTYVIDNNENKLPGYYISNYYILVTNNNYNLYNNGNLIGYLNNHDLSIKWFRPEQGTSSATIELVEKKDLYLGKDLFLGKESSVTLDTSYTMPIADSIDQVISLDPAKPVELGKVGDGVNTSTGQPTSTIDFNIPIDSPTIDISPILNLGEVATNKFPFSIPFDVYRILNLFVAPPKENIIFTAVINGKQFDIDINFVKPILPYVKTLSLISFDIGLIMIARKLSNPSE